MKTTFGLSLLLAATASIPANAVSLSAGTFSKCYTSRVSTYVKSASTVSLSQTSTRPVYQYTTVTPTSTITPPPATTTITVSTDTTVGTSLTQVADTITTTLVVKETDTSTAGTLTSTVSTTTTSTTVLSSGTTTIPTSAGFTPVQSTLPGAAAKKRSIGAQADQPTSPRHGTLFARAQRKAKAPTTKKRFPFAQSWAKSVTCYKTFVTYKITVITKTATTTVTTTLPTVTKTSTVTQTNTIMSTVAQSDAETTVTQTSTSTSLIITTPVTTSTTTVIASQTVVIPLATSYAACSAANIVGTVNGEGITHSSFDGTYSTTTDITAYNCCVSCINNPLCSSSFFGGIVSGSNSCFNLVATGTCSSEGQYSITALIDTEFAADSGYFISNGNCGFYTASGDDGED